MAMTEDKKDVIRTIFSILLPPVGVFLQVGIGNIHFWINVLLTLLGYLPGVLHAIWVIYTFRDKELKAEIDKHMKKAEELEAQVKQAQERLDKILEDEPKEQKTVKKSEEKEAAKNEVKTEKKDSKKKATERTTKKTTTKKRGRPKKSTSTKQTKKEE